MKVVRLSALRTGRLYPSGNIPGTHFCSRLSRPQGHSAAGRIMSTENPNDTTGNRTRDLPVCSAVPYLSLDHLIVGVCRSRTVRHTHTHTHATGLLWKFGKPVAGVATYTTHNKDKKRNKIKICKFIIYNVVSYGRKTERKIYGEFIWRQEGCWEKYLQLTWRKTRDVVKWLH
jgi:hypothetical protein